MLGKGAVVGDRVFGWTAALIGLVLNVVLFAAAWGAALLFFWLAYAFVAGSAGGFWLSAVAALLVAAFVAWFVNRAVGGFANGLVELLRRG